MKKNKLVIFDVCHTLVDIDSTKFYIEFLKSLWYKRFKRLNIINNKIFILFSAIINKIFKYNIHRKTTLMFFWWINKKNIEKSKNIFLKSYINKITNLLEDLIKYRDIWDKVILLSASINPPIQILWEYLWIETYSSILNLKNWIYTWKVKYDLLGNKQEILEKKDINIKNFSETIFYTDNLEDIWLIQYIKNHVKKYKIYIKINDKKNHKKRQKILLNNNILNYEFIY